MNDKKIQEMTDEEVLDFTAKAIKEYMSRIRPHGEFVLEACVRSQLGELKRFFLWSRGLSVRRPEHITSRDHQEWNLCSMHFEPLMRERARIYQMNYNKEEALWKIRGTSASAMIVNAFDEIGLKANVECQKYRAKVFVDLGGRLLRFYVGYKAIEKRNCLPDVVQAVVDLKDAICRLGGDIRLGK